MIIYKLTNIETQKAYIGQTIKLIEKRWKEHCHNAKQGKGGRLYEAIRQFGENCWCLEIIETLTEKSFLNEREKFWIQYFDTFNNGYNSTEDGQRKVIPWKPKKSKLSLSGRKKPPHCTQKLWDEWLERQALMEPILAEQALKRTTKKQVTGSLFYRLQSNSK